jgi:hypothetical protein
MVRAEHTGQQASRPADGRFRFPRSGRLLRRADFERVYKQGQRHFAAHMTFFYLPGAGPDLLMVCISANEAAPALPRLQNSAEFYWAREMSSMAVPVWCAPVPGEC